MALMTKKELEDGIRIGDSLDSCEICAKKDRKLHTGEQEGNEVFSITISGLTHVYCMDHFKQMLGKYVLVDPNKYLIVPKEDIKVTDEPVIDEEPKVEDKAEDEAVAEEEAAPKTTAKKTSSRKKATADDDKATK